MIRRIHVRDLGNIEKAEVNLAPGLNVITGETGTGKTMLLRGLDLVMGGKSEVSWIRTGSTESEVECSVEVGNSPVPGPLLEELDAHVDDGAVTLVRVLGTSRSRAFAGGRSVPSGSLAELTDPLIAVHGQHEQRQLARPAKQRQLVDAFAGPAHCLSVAEFEVRFTAIRALEHQIAEFESGLAHSAVRRQHATEMVAEFDRIQPHAGEVEQLRHDIEFLSNSVEFSQSLSNALAALDGTDEQPGALSQLMLAQRSLERVRGTSEVIVEMLTRLEPATNSIRELRTQLLQLSSEVDAGESRLDHLHTRLREISQPLKVHGFDTVEQWQLHVDGLRTLVGASHDSEKLRSLQGELKVAHEEQIKRAADINERRSDAATRLAMSTTHYLQQLALPQYSLKITVTPSAMNRYGADVIGFSLVVDPSGVGVPLGKGVSGGEMSRISLAIEVALAGADPVPTMVFDEVDAGIGGVTAHEVGRLLSQLALTTQVVVVTHLPQVAAYAHHHICVQRLPEGVSVSELITDESRIRELARMLGAVEGMDGAEELARQMMAMARSARSVS